MSDYSIRTAAIVTGKFLRFIGYATFSQKDNKIVVTPFDFACLTFNLIIGFFLFYLSLRFGIELFSSYSILLAMGIFVTMMCGSVVIIIAMIFAFLHRQRIWKVILVLENAMEKFRMVHVNPNFKRYVMVFALTAALSVFLIIFGLIIMIIWLDYHKKLLILVVYGYLSASFAASMGWSSIFHLGIYLRLNLINQTIR